MCRGSFAPNTCSFLMLTCDCASLRLREAGSSHVTHENNAYKDEVQGHWSERNETKKDLGSGVDIPPDFESLISMPTSCKLPSTYRMAYSSFIMLSVGESLLLCTELRESIIIKLNYYIRLSRSCANEPALNL